jgi:peptide/nickel transport system permease protein
MSAFEVDARPGTPSRRTLRLNGLIIAGIVILAVVALATVFAPLLTEWRPKQIDPINFLEPPMAEHWFGTDSNGMDVFSRALYAARVDLGVAVLAVALAVVVGTFVGLVVGYAGGWVDEVAMRGLDIVQAFPVFILALTVAAVFGNSLINLIVAIGLINAPPYARLMRAEIRSLREHIFVEAAECAGNSRSSILFRHLLPNALTPILVIAPLNCGWAILMLAGLSFVGLGVPVPEAEWGAMISAGAADIVGGRWWTTIFPGFALFGTVLGFNLVGEGLQQFAGKRR